MTGVVFTLSGSLVTALLLREYDRYGCVDIPAFHPRRARRILPPLAAYYYG